MVAGNAIREALAEAREEQRQQHEAEMAELKAEAEERHRQHEAELQAAKAEREEQSRQHSNEVATVQEQLRKAKSLLIGVAAGAVGISVVALIVGIIF